MLKIAVSKAVTGGVDAVTILPPYMYSTLHTLPACLGLWRQIKLYTTIRHNSASLGGPWVLGVVRMENRVYCTFNNKHVRTDLSLSVALPTPIRDWSTQLSTRHPIALIISLRGDCGVGCAV